MPEITPELILAIRENVSAALNEDLGGLDATCGDITAQLIDKDQQIRARIITRETCVMAGSAWLDETFQQLDKDVRVDWQVQDGQHLAADQTLCFLTGNARSLLTGERTALNFIQTLSATATTTQNSVKYLQGSKTKLLDTRKTLPGLRLAQKYAVTCGGGYNHRVGLYDAFLIKENHILACGSIAAAISKARQLKPSVKVEVEVENLAELHQAIAAQADIVMLDNFSLAQVHQAVELAAGRCKLEVSGNITWQGLGELAKTGVDYISSGALTKHVRAIDLSFRVLEAV